MALGMLSCQSSKDSQLYEKGLKALAGSCLSTIMLIQIFVLYKFCKELCSHYYGKYYYCWEDQSSINYKSYWVGGIHYEDWE